MIRRPLLCLAVLALLGCDDPGNPGGGGGTNSLASQPKSILGKAVKSAKDTRQALSEGGNSREAVVQNAQIKLEQMAETITALKARAKGESAEKAVNLAEKKHKQASDLAEKMQSSTAPDDGTEVKTLRDAVEAAQAAINHAKEVVGE